MSRLETWYKQDLKKPLIVHKHADVFNQDSRGNLIGVEVYSDGEPVTLTGSISGYCLLADGTTVPAVGASRSGNKASVLIPQTAYNVPGVITVTIKNVDGNDITTLCAVVGLVRQSVSGNLVNPGSVVTDWSNSINAQLQAVQDAADNVGAIVAAPFAENTVYVAGNYVTNNGNLYRITGDHAAGVTWANTAKTQCTVGTELYDLKSALNNIPVTVLSSVGGIDYTTGETESTNSARHTDYIDVSTYKAIMYRRMGVTGTNTMLGMAFYDSNKDYISGEQIKISNSAKEYAEYKTIIVPDDAKYARFSTFADTATYGNFIVCGTNAIENSVFHTINEMRADVFIRNEVSWGFGGISGSSGSDGSSSNTAFIRCGYLPSNIKTIHVNLGYKYVLYAYTEQEYIGVWNGSDFVQSVYYLDSDTQLEKVGSYKFRIVLVNIQGTEMSLTDANNIYLYANTDMSLTKTGKSADAFVVGNALNEIFVTSPYNPMYWENGGIAGGTGQDGSPNPYFIRCSYIPKNTKKIHVKTGYKYVLYAYGDSYVGVWDGSKFVLQATYLTEDTDLSLVGNYNFRIVLRSTTDNTNISPSDAVNIELTGYTDTMLTQSGKPADAKTVGEKLKERTFVVVVDSSGQGKYTSVVDAMINEPENTVIIVKPGIYNEDMGKGSGGALKKRVILIGVDRTTCIIRCADGRRYHHALYVSCGYFENLTFETPYISGISHDLTKNEYGAYAVHIDTDDDYGVGKTVEFHHCNILSDFSAAIGIGLRKDMHFTLDDCNIVSGQPSGIGPFVDDGSYGALFMHDSNGTQGDQYFTMKDCLLQSKNYANAMCISHTSNEEVSNHTYLTFINNVLKSTAGYVSNVWLRDSPMNVMTIDIGYGNSASALNS